MVGGGAFICTFIYGGGGFYCIVICGGGIFIATFICGGIINGAFKLIETPAFGAFEYKQSLEKDIVLTSNT